MLPKPKSITQIEQLLGTTLYPASQKGTNLVANAMRARRNPETKDEWLCQYAVDPDGQTITGLNLMGSNLDDAQWADIAELLEGESLEGLNLRGNRLKKSPLTATMTRLEYLDICDNRLETLVFPDGAKIPPFIFLSGNENLQNPPPEFVSQGRFAIKGYFEDIQSQGVEKLYEAKLILVGDGGAGKTTLRTKLINPDAPLPAVAESTKGVDIDINNYTFTGLSKQPFQVNIWDFAGQEQYQPIHQFFYTHRALYVLVVNSREQKTDFDKWLEMVQICSDGSPVILVHNEFGDQTWSNFRLEDLQAKYPFLKASYRVNFATGRGLLELKQGIEFYIQQLPHVGEALPKKSAIIRKALRTIAVDEPVLSWKQYLQLCADPKHDLSAEKAKDLSRYLHILGAMLHYEDNDLLSQYLILQNIWATDAVYRILEDNDIVYKTRGRFTDEDLARIWTRPDWADMRPQLLELMKKFKLCYQILNEKKYIAPQLLSSIPPKDYDWVTQNDLQLEIRYPIMPRGLLTRFTVTRHSDIANGQTLVWSEGVVLEWNHTKAQVTEHFGDKKIKIKVQGRERKAFRSIIEKTFEDLHTEFKGLKSVPPSKWIPCDCSKCIALEDPHFFSFEVLIEYKNDCIDEIRCDKSRQLRNVLQLIDDVTDAESHTEVARKSPKSASTGSKIPRIFISYSKHDLSWLIEFKKQLNPLVRAQKLVHWDDSRILPGEDWDVSIQTALREAEIVVFLVSPDLLNTNYVLDTELDIALNRHEQGEAILIPVKVRPCHWNLTPLGCLQGIPRKDLIISTAPDQDSAWFEVVDEIRKLIDAKYGGG